MNYADYKVEIETLFDLFRYIYHEKGFGVKYRYGCVNGNGFGYYPDYDFDRTFPLCYKNTFSFNLILKDNYND